MSIRDRIKGKAIKTVLSLVANVSEENIHRTLSLLRKIHPSEYEDEILEKAVEYAFGEGSSFIQLFKRVMLESAPAVREKLIDNLIIRWRSIEGPRRWKEYEETYGCEPPMFFVMSPTMVCNLKCKGCYAAEYTRADDLSHELIDRVLSEGKEIGMYFVVISGGEPFIRRDLLEIFAKHDDIYFLVYTNGYFINKELAEKLGELGNVAPAISVEGFEKETDDRRGKGAYDHILTAMDNLAERGVIFGFSATPTIGNSNVIATEEFFDFYIEKGCKFGWIFQYVPIGRCPQPELMSTPEQRNRLREVVQEVRRTRPIFIGDFWNDGPLVGGCLAGGRRYFHINVHGDVEPCVFQHFAVDNIKEKPLAECLNSEFFRAMRATIPKFRNNLYMPCMIIDRPQVLRALVKRYGARPTHPGAETIIEDKRITQWLDEYSRRLKEVTSEAWEKDFGKVVLKEERVP